MRRILLTRSEEENNRIAEKLSGFEVISCPMLFYKDPNVDWEEFKDYSHLIITSKYAAKLISEHYPFKVTAYVVGEESARLLEQNPNVTLVGVFRDVGEIMGAFYGPASSRNEQSSYPGPSVIPDLDPGSINKSIPGPRLGGRGDRPGLRPRMTGRGKPLPQDDGRVLYLSGNHITQDVPFATRKEIYHTEYADSIDPEIFKEDIDYVMIYSKNSANNLIKLLGEQNLLQKIENSATITLSKNLAHQMEDYVKEILCPEKPLSEEMINILLEYERQTAR